jgi:O-glycosyl hydrolase
MSRQMIVNMNIFKHQTMYYLWLIFAILSVSGCNKEDKTDDTGAEYLEITVLGNTERQEIHGFGASDAWSCQFIGKNWPDVKKNQLADWLFSTEFQNNNPKGIGLNIWRFNIGAGSTQQGGSSGIGDEWRRAESFLTPDKTYNWNAQQGQRWFLKAAKQRGVEIFIGFVNSPPVALSKNGKAFSSNGSQHNLAPEKYSEFADYLAEIVLKTEQNDGVKFDYVSPFNEPQWDWTDGGQEGSPAQNSEIAAVVREIDKVFNQKNISSKIEIPESAQLNYIYEDDNKPARGSQADAFFNPGSANYLGNLSHVAQKIAGHSYYTTWPLSRLEQTRLSVKNEIASISDPVEFWMTEYCVLENNEEISGGGRDLSMKTALYVARVVFADLVLANANSWQWWLAISPYDYKDGLVYTDYNKNDGQIFDSKTLWAFGNFSRFVKPGMKRVALTRSDGRGDGQTLDGLMASSFVSGDKSKTTIVLINYGETSIPVKLALKDIASSGILKIYLTDGKSENDLAFQGNFDLNEVYEMPPRAVVTISNQD